MNSGWISVVYTSLDTFETTELDSLSSSEVRRAGRFKAPRRRQQYFCGRALLRAVLERHSGDPAASHDLITDANGKPHCVDGPAVSIAHSGSIVVCAVAEHGAIGIDIEGHCRRRDTRGIAERYFSGDEAHWLALQPDDRFYMLWVLKEAWLKCTGSGLGGGLDDLRCRVIPPRIYAHLRDGNPSALRLYAVENAYIGLATTTPVQKDVTVEYWEPHGNRFGADCGLELIASTDSAPALNSSANSLTTRQAPQPHQSS
ncbi:MAG: 4'-phosphopantetheinyl transferase superfamily protein [Gammaproteobacteria bacterium]|nr:4'-phosphopantetheinyl transferase superfamily protein [Gammaproteobacteria bacterium]MDH3372024.1 4'-phosphopantetheinyl transferase superfamily protein [Gammaproteobacteria bacterium]MDH3410207.1 4'-phosphopantetheinyl transferase superfamily protein [Gammaproteobacteria bacterium]